MKKDLFLLKPHNRRKRVVDCPPGLVLLGTELCLLTYGNRLIRVSSGKPVHRSNEITTRELMQLVTPIDVLPAALSIDEETDAAFDTESTGRDDGGDSPPPEERRRKEPGGAQGPS